LKISINLNFFSQLFSAKVKRSKVKGQRSKAYFFTWNCLKADRRERWHGCQAFPPSPSSWPCWRKMRNWRDSRSSSRPT
jgi:hypothetical protein